MILVPLRFRRISKGGRKLRGEKGTEASNSSKQKKRKRGPFSTPIPEKGGMRLRKKGGGRRRKTRGRGITVKGEELCSGRKKNVKTESPLKRGQALSMVGTAGGLPPNGAKGTRPIGEAHFAKAIPMARRKGDNLFIHQGESTGTKKRRNLISSWEGVFAIHMAHADPYKGGNQRKMVREGQIILTGGQAAKNHCTGHPE